MAPCWEPSQWAGSPGARPSTAPRSGWRTPIPTRPRRCRSSGELNWLLFPCPDSCQDNGPTRETQFPFRRLHVMSKAIRLSILVPLALSWLCGSALAQGGVTNSTKNPAQIATLHWYEANLTANFPVASVGGEGGLGFDGANIWATNGRGVVTKVRASDGAVLGVFSDSQVTDCHRTVYDGANLWIGCSNGITGGILDKIRASDGAVIGRSSGLGFIQSIAFDGASVWVTTIVSSFTQLVKVRASDGAALGFFNIDGANGVVFDGANIWVTN